MAQLHTLFGLRWQTSGWCAIGFSPQDSCVRRAARQRERRHVTAALKLPTGLDADTGRKISRLPEQGQHGGVCDRLGQTFLRGGPRLPDVEVTKRPMAAHKKWS